MQINPLYFCSDALTFSSRALIGFLCCHKRHYSNTQLYVQFPKPWHPPRDRGAKVLIFFSPTEVITYFQNLIKESSRLLSKRYLFTVYLKNKENLALMSNYLRLFSLESEVLFPSFSPILAFLKHMYHPGEHVPCKSTKCHLNV